MKIFNYTEIILNENHIQEFFTDVETFDEALESLIETYPVPAGISHDDVSCWMDEVVRDFNDRNEADHHLPLRVTRTSDSDILKTIAEDAIHNELEGEYHISDFDNVNGDTVFLDKKVTVTIEETVDDGDSHDCSIVTIVAVTIDEDENWYAMYNNNAWGHGEPVDPQTTIKEWLNAWDELPEQWLRELAA